MDDSERVTVDISADLIAAVNEAVSAGRYVSTDDIINDGLGLWRESQTQNTFWAPPGIDCSAEEHDRWFRAEVQKTLVGLADGTVGILSDEEHKTRRSQRLAVIRARVAGLGPSDGLPLPKQTSTGSSHISPLQIRLLRKE